MSVCINALLAVVNGAMFILAITERNHVAIGFFGFATLANLVVALSGR